VAVRIKAGTPAQKPATADNQRENKTIIAQNALLAFG
jgi:hypothetical protein